MTDYDVVIKEVGPQPIVAAREVVPAIDQMPARCQALAGAAYGLLEQARVVPAGPCFALYYNPEYTERDIDVEMAFPVDAAAARGIRVPEDSPARVRELAGAIMASVLHQGPYETILAAYRALGTWIAANGYTIAGPSREIYLRGPEAGDPATYLTEIQFPVRGD